MMRDQIKPIERISFFNEMEAKQYLYEKELVRLRSTLRKGFMSVIVILAVSFVVFLKLNMN